MKRKLLHQIFAWIGRSIYDCRTWMEKMQDWADHVADKFDPDNASL